MGMPVACCETLGLVEQRARHGATVDDDNRHLHGAVVEHQRPGVERVVDFHGEDLVMFRAVNDHRKFYRRNINGGGPGAEQAGFVVAGGWVRGGEICEAQDEDQPNAPPAPED